MRTKDDFRSSNGKQSEQIFFFELNAVNWISFQDGETILLKKSFRVLYRMEYWFVHTNLSRDRRCKKISRYNNYFYEPHLGIVFYFCFIESRCCSQFLDNRIFTNCYVQKFSSLKNLFFFVCKINYIYIYIKTQWRLFILQQFPIIFYYKRIYI